MAAIMKCPSCEFLAEIGDMEKGRNRKPYRVYDSVANLIEEDGEKRVLECLACGYFAEIDNGMIINIAKQPTTARDEESSPVS